MLSTVLARRLGVERTGRSLHKRMRQQLGATVTQLNIFTNDRRDIVRLDVNGYLGHIGMLVTAIDVDEISEQSKIAIQQLVC